MDKIKEFLKKPQTLIVGGLLVGMIIGLVVLGWGLWPLQWVDASPSDLQMDYQRDYVCMTIDSYIRNQNDRLVQLRWNGLGENASDLLDTLTPAVCGFESEKEIKAFKEVIGFVPPISEGTTELISPEEVTPSVPEFMAEPQPENKFSLVPLLILLALTVVVGGVFFFLMKKKAAASGSQNARPVKPHNAFRPENKEPAGFSPAAAPAAPKKEPPLAQFMSTYRQGDDLYDDSFSIDSVNGEFLGECGVGIAETIGVGDPKKVTALEVWLFDKNDIQTVTKILMSEHASNDSAIRQRLLSKGEPIKVEPGMRFVMETATLQLEAKVIDMVYARGPLPENSYFSPYHYGNIRLVQVTMRENKKARKRAFLFI